MKKILIFGGIGLVLVIIGVVAAVFLLNREPAVEEVHIVHLEFPLGEQYTNITMDPNQPTTRKTVLKFNSVIQYVGEEMTAILPEKQTLLINEFRKYFMSRTAVQLANLDRVQEDLTEIAIELLESDSETITNVFFLEFIIQ